MDEFCTVCLRRKIRLSVQKSKAVMVFERKEVEEYDFSKPYRVSGPVARCEVILIREKMAEVKV